jgi:hypothetical protein
VTQPDDSIVTEENGTTPDVDNTHTATGDDGTVTPQSVVDDGTPEEPEPAPENA